VRGVALSVIIPTRRHNCGTSAHRQAKRNARHAESPMIAKTFIIAKTFRSHSVKFFRHDKSLRDHRDEPGCSM
jgi:hypothetical protein